MGVSFQALPDVPLVEAGDDLSAVTLAAVRAAGDALQDGDLIVMAQKIVSKAEGRLISLADVKASEEAERLAEETEKDPRLVQLILDESTEVLRKRPGVLIVRHRLGLVGAHAGIDQSNIQHGEVDNALLLPMDPDASAARLRDGLRAAAGCNVGVIVSDSMNRPWRLGTVGCAIGCAGLLVLDDRRGGTDLYGRELKVTLINRADSIASMATLVMGETTERTPIVLVRGFASEDGAQTARDVIRPLDEDLFR